MKIYLSVLNEGWIRSELAIKLVRWIATSTYPVYYESSNERPIEHNRNLIVQRFLASDSDYLLQIDNDVVPNTNPILLADYQKDIITCPVPIYQEKVFYNNYIQEHDYLVPVTSGDMNGLMEIDSTGTGIIMCSRRVLETIKKPFERLYDDNGLAMLGSDLYFSKKAKEAGFKIFTDTSNVCKHYKTLNLAKFT